MRTYLCIFIVFLLLLKKGWSQEPFIQGDSLLLVENSLKKLNKNINFTVIPGPVYGATERLGFVVLPMIVYNLDKSDKLSPPSSSALMIYFDFYGSWQVAAKQSFYWNQNKWRAFITAGLGKMQFRFFGIGRDTVIINNDDSNFDWITGTQAHFSASCYRKVVSNFFAGLEYAYTYSFVAARDSSGTARLANSEIKNEEKIFESVLVPTFVWDNRDNIFWTTKGYYSNLNLQFSNAILGSTKDYGIVTGWVNGYHNLLKNNAKLTLAWHFYTHLGWGELPFTRYATYGGGDNVVGYTRGKYVDYSEITAQTEIRYDVWKFIGAGVYMGTGKVFPTVDMMWKSVWLHFGGVRMYVNIIPSRNIRVRLDLAIARKDVGFYVGIGQGF
jgi:hypothetical protein